MRQNPQPWTSSLVEIDGLMPLGCGLACKRRNRCGKCPASCSVIELGKQRVLKHFV